MPVTGFGTPAADVEQELGPHRQRLGSGGGPLVANRALHVAALDG
jgi:hypothetical protein